MRNTIIVALALGLFLTSCIYRRNKHTGPLNLIQDIPIKEAGIYISKERNLVLNIKINNMIVEYLLTDTTGRILYKNKKPDASDVQKWFFILDKNSNVWFNSSDIGLFLMKRTSDSSFSLVTFDNDFFDKKSVPTSVYDELPSSLKKSID